MPTEVGTARTLDATGFGEVRVRPDIAIVRLSVVTQAQTAAEAVQQNAQLAQPVIQQIMALGVPQEDIQTSSLNINPVFSDDEPPVLVGFRVENAISARVPVDLAGRVFDVGVQAGANVSRGISFALRDEGPSRVAALQAAVNAARRDAEAVVNALAGVTLLGPQEIEIDPERVELGFERAGALPDIQDPGTPVLPRDINISARVRIRYIINFAG